jgi:metal-responsive CopG/Arc/MetJ family transcriptional regulator
LYNHGYTFRTMKTAISIPDDVFSRAEGFAHRQKMTRSALFTVAVDEYVQKHRSDDVTRKLNEVYAKEDSSLDPVLERLQALSIPKEEW